MPFIVELSISDYHRNLIVKRQIANLARRQLFRCDVAFLNEVAVYSHVIPCLRRFIASRSHLPLPQCLFAGRDAQGDLIALEDLVPSGHRMANRLKGLDYSHCKIVMQVIIDIAFKLSLTMGFLIITGVGRVARYGACNETKRPD